MHCNALGSIEFSRLSRSLVSSCSITFYLDGRQYKARILGERSKYLSSKFTEDAQILYSEDSMSFNVHQLKHLVGSAENWGPLWAHSGNTFENGNHLLLNMVHAGGGVLNQICRKFSQNQSERMIGDQVKKTSGSSNTGLL